LLFAAGAAGVLAFEAGFFAPFELAGLLDRSNLFVPTATSFSSVDLAKRARPRTPALCS
jgi:hypothetical protein